MRDRLNLLIGCKFRYRYVDWYYDVWSPWYVLTEARYEDMVNDNSIDKIQVEL